MPPALGSRTHIVCPLMIRMKVLAILHVVDVLGSQQCYAQQELRHAAHEWPGNPGILICFVAHSVMIQQNCLRIDVAASPTLREATFLQWATGSPPASNEPPYPSAEKWHFKCQLRCDRRYSQHLREAAPQTAAMAVSRALWAAARASLAFSRLLMRMA